MTNVYLINELVFFNPESFTLTPRQSYPAGKITLHGPASECLRILISHPYQPVAQKTLFEQVWERKGVVVSTNTLYQSIASIRKGLKAAGLEEEIIRTLPKQGFQCNATVRVGEIAEFIPPPVVHINTDLPVVVPQRQEEPPAAAKNPRFTILLSALISLAIVGSLIAWRLSVNSPREPAYYSSGQVQNCSLFSSWPDEEYSRAVFSDLQKRYPIRCENKHTAYLTINRLQLKTSVILCNESMESDTAKCKAILFKDDDENN